MANAAKKLVENESLTSMSVVKNQPEAQAEAPELTVVPEQPKAPVLSLEERIQRVEDLAILVEKRGQLQASLREISTFKLSSDAMSNRITLRNVGAQREFNTSNSEVISEIIDVIIRKIEGKLREVEAMITF
jgi:hypothetical protein